ncbi:MAG TPA: Npt1/Npt2 family nucleotide transporter [Chondromyces sp.]|nr:Npt1/Npt2 family nucleotide transporter [Chondromyces sp.]
MSFLNRLVAVEPDELRPMLWAALYNFLLLAAYFVIRPVRDEMGIAGGVRNLPWLFLGTLLGMLLVHPLFSALVGRLPRRLFVPLSYGFFVVNLLVFWVFFLTLPPTSAIWTGRVFFIWTSVFNLFVVSIFWSVMADLFRPEQAKRLFGFVAVGGTIGAASGSASTAFLASRVTPTNLLVLSAVLLGLAMLAAHNLMRSSALAEARREVPIADAGAAVGGRILDGVRAAFSSPYLIGIVGYMLLYTITSTFLYFQQAGIVDTSLTDRAARTVFFARIDLAVNSLTALIQIFFTGRIVRRIGVALSLATLPLVSLLGFGAVGVWPTLTAIAVVQVLRRTSNYAIARPCREMLYTVVSRDSKYKAKNFIDTFVYRFGDQVGAWTSGLLMLVGLGGALISVVAAPLAAVWLAVGLWLGRRQAAMATAGPGNPAAPRTTPGPG